MSIRTVWQSARTPETRPKRLTNQQISKLWKQHRKRQTIEEFVTSIAIGEDLQIHNWNLATWWQTSQPS